MNILQEADQITSGDRNRQYGDPLDNHGTTAMLWSTWLYRRHGFLGTLTAEDVCFLNILQKVSRGANGSAVKRDTITDIAGFARNIEMVGAARALRADCEEAVVLEDTDPCTE